MSEQLIAFIIWTIMGVFFIGTGISTCFSKKEKPFGFWANVKVTERNDVKGYNRALGKLWCVYGILFILVGLPLLTNLNTWWIIVPILGTMLLTIATMIIYTIGIEPKYRKKDEIKEKIKERFASID